MIEIVKNIVRFFALVFLQIVIFNNIDISIFLSPMVIIIFILSLPFNTPKWVLLLSAFFLGMLVDLYMNTPGILSFSTVLMAYLRPFILNVIRPRDGYSIGALPRVADLGWSWFLQYSTVITILFHLIYFLILGLSEENFLIIIWKTIISSVFTLSIILLFQLFSIKK